MEVVQWAAAHEHALALRGNGSKTSIGRPVNDAHILDLSGFSGIKQYDPVELVLTAGAGTPLAEIEAATRNNQQMLAFEPPAYAFTGSSDDVTGATLGGILAGNISGPRRFFAGAARDHFLGFKAVSGRGEHFKSGGQVVKNVTGFDLSKLMAGSWGTLAALWEVSVKVLPLPEKTRTLLVLGLDVQHAMRVITAAVASPHGVSGAAYLSKVTAARSQISHVDAPVKTGVIALRVEGPEPSVNYRIKALKTLISQTNKIGEMSELHSQSSLTLWREVANLDPLHSHKNSHKNGQLWRLALPPTSAIGAATKLTDLGINDWLIDQAGGAIWLTCADGGVGRIRNILGRSGGHATLWHGPAAFRAEADVFHPQSAALKMLTRRVKTSFDPQAIFNRGRMYRDI